MPWARHATSAALGSGTHPVELGVPALGKAVQHRDHPRAGLRSGPPLAQSPATVVGPHRGRPLPQRGAGLGRRPRGTQRPEHATHHHRTGHRRDEPRRPPPQRGLQRIGQRIHVGPPCAGIAVDPALNYGVEPRRNPPHGIAQRHTQRTLIACHRVAIVLGPAGVGQAREAEVPQPHATVMPHQPVAGLDVAVHQPGGVRRRQPARELDERFDDRPQRPRLTQPPLQGDPLDVFHRDVSMLHPGDGAQGANVEHRHHVGMRHPADRPRLVGPARRRVGGHRPEAGAQRQQDLQRDAPVDVRVVGLVDHALITGADASAQTVAPDHHRLGLGAPQQRVLGVSQRPLLRDRIRRGVGDQRQPQRIIDGHPPGRTRFRHRSDVDPGWARRQRPGAQRLHPVRERAQGAAAQLGTTRRGDDGFSQQRTGSRQSTAHGPRRCIEHHRNLLGAQAFPVEQLERDLMVQRHAPDRDHEQAALLLERGVGLGVDLFVLRERVGVGVERSRRPVVPEKGEQSVPRHAEQVRPKRTLRIDGVARFDAGEEGLLREVLGVRGHLAAKEAKHRDEVPLQQPRPGLGVARAPGAEQQGVARGVHHPNKCAATRFGGKSSRFAIYDFAHKIPMQHIGSSCTWPYMTRHNRLLALIAVALLGACDQGGANEENSSPDPAGGKADEVDGCNAEDPERPMCEPLVACGIHCPFGQAQDENGCTLCDCNPSPLECEGLTEPCDNACPNGFLTDVQGCPTCECAPDPTCEPIDDCGLGVCPFGFATDADGCPQCACADPPGCLEPPECSGQCLHGTLPDADGCPTCECAPAPECPPISECGLGGCLFGLATDDNGCTLCECADDPFG